MADIFIRELWIYPVKSLGGVRVERALATAVGSLAFDREWIVTDPDCRMLWQGDIPRMTLVRVALGDAALTLGRDGHPDFTLPLDHPGRAVTTTMYKHDLHGTDAGDAAADWLSTALGTPVRLVRLGDAAHRWSGLNPVHIVSDASIAALNEALFEQADAPVTTPRFRPNIVLASTTTRDAWLEETAPVLDFGDARLVLREPCVRCELPNISLVDASRGKQPLKLIGQLSKSRPAAKPASFGTYAAIEGRELRTGMRASL